MNASEGCDISHPETPVKHKHTMVLSHDLWVWNELKNQERKVLFPVMIMDLPLWFNLGDTYDLCSMCKGCKVGHIDFFDNGRTPKLPPYAVVHMRSKSEALQVVKELNGRVIGSKELVVEAVHDKPFLFDDYSEEALLKSEGAGPNYRKTEKTPFTKRSQVSPGNNYKPHKTNRDPAYRKEL